MTKDEFDTLIEEARWQAEKHDGEWSIDGAIEMSFMEARALAEAMAEKRELEQLRELIIESHQERSNENDQ